MLVGIPSTQEPGLQRVVPRPALVGGGTDVVEMRIRPQQPLARDVLAAERRAGSDRHQAEENGHEIALRAPLAEEKIHRGNDKHTDQNIIKNRGDGVILSARSKMFPADSLPRPFVREQKCKHGDAGSADGLKWPLPKRRRFAKPGVPY